MNLNGLVFSMNEATIHQQVRTVVCGVANTSRFADDDDLLRQGIIDSLGTIHLIYGLEEAFRITICQEEITRDHLNSVRSMTEFVREKIDA